MKNAVTAATATNTASTNLSSSSSSSTRLLRYQQVEGAFSNPNGDVAEVTAEWLYATVGDIRRLRGGSGAGASSSLLPSLVELYSGNGNHTVNLSPHFRRVTAVEIEPRLVAAAYENFSVNGLDNAACRALPAEVFARAQKTRRTTTKKHIKTQPAVAANNEKEEAVAAREEEEDILTCAGEHGVVLVDPPRVGLDPDTLALVRQFRSILYIACDARSLRRDLHERGLGESHEVGRMALFDHFPFSKFCEVVVWLEKKEGVAL